MSEIDLEQQDLGEYPGTPYVAPEGPPGRTGPQCHSYSPAGDRCEHDAGHSGEHIVSMTWTDDEAWTPDRSGMLIAPQGITYGPDPTAQHLVNVPKTSGRCVICEHRLHDGLCGARMPDSELGCDCSNGVEE